MIEIKEKPELVNIAVFGEFTLDDYQQFEQAVTTELKSSNQIDLLMDLTQMSGFTMDVAWEDIKFTRQHYHDFKRIAIVSDDQWISWTAWLGTAFTDADIEVFQNAASAEDWLGS